MKIFRSIDEIELDQSTALTVGTFDGVHRGHQEVLSLLGRRARELDCLEVLVTFHPHPQFVVGPKHGKELQLLTDLDEKLELLNQLRFPAVVVIPFTREFSQTSYQDFVKDILVKKLHVKMMAIGYDHAFGRNREGHREQLEKMGEKYNFMVEVVPPYYMDEEIVSSTLIRQNLNDGNVMRANELLGRHYSIQGKVVTGQRRGRDLGFPTANIQVNQSHRLIPKEGVYAVDVWLKGNRHRGMMNIGHRPTFNIDPLTLEVHIINFTGSLYSEVLKIEFKRFIREEKQFKNAEELKKQLIEDKKVCENI